MVRPTETEQKAPSSLNPDNDGGHDKSAITAHVNTLDNEQQPEFNDHNENAEAIGSAKPESLENDGESTKSDPEMPNLLKTSAPIDRIDWRKNSKFDPSVLPDSDDVSQIRKQVHFYFGDSNLATDVFLRGKMDGEDNKPVSLNIILTFSRMKKFKPYETVVAALKGSHVVDVIGEEGEEMIKRKIPWKPTEQMSRDERSIYAKGFGDEEPSTQFDIEAFFAPYGPLNSVRLRRTFKYFKGSCFVEFSDLETYEKFLALEPKPSWKGKHELLIMPKVVYQKVKNDGIKEGTVEMKDDRAKGHSRGGNFGGRGRGRGRREGDRFNRDRGDRDPDNWKRRRDHDQANGFKDHRSNRGGRDRGRRHDRGPRNDDRNQESKQRKSTPDVQIEVTAAEAKPSSMFDSGVQAMDPAESSTSPTQNDKKRPHENDGNIEGQPAKKIHADLETADAT